MCMCVCVCACILKYIFIFITYSNVSKASPHGLHRVVYKYCVLLLLLLLLHKKAWAQISDIVKYYLYNQSLK